MYFPGGLVQVAYAIRGAIVRAVERRLPPAAAGSAPVRLAASPHGDRRGGVEATPAGAPDLAVRGLRVTFGERPVVDGVDLHVDHNEVVGLIGANGAGKTTIMNAIGGFVPAEGHVELLGHEHQLAVRRPAGRARPRPVVPGRPPVRRPDRARDRGAGPRAGAADPDARGADRHPHLAPPRPRAARPGPTSWSTTSVSAASPTTSSARCRPAPAASASWRASSPSSPG